MKKALSIAKSAASAMSVARRNPGGGGVLPYMGYIGTCRGIGYGFWRFSILK